MVADIWFQPALRGGTAAALIDEFVVGDANGLSDEAAGLLQLLDVLRGVSHRSGNAVCGEGDVRGLIFRKRSFHVFDDWPDEAGVIVEDTKLVDLRRTFANFGLSGDDVLAILPAA